MNETMRGSGSGGDEAAAWRARLGWTFGLIADDPAERATALEHLDRARSNTQDALDRFNELWHLTRPLGPEEQYQELAFRRAGEVYHNVRRRSFPDGLWDGNRGAGVMGWPGLPYAVLFLEWEARFPREWTAHAKAWSTKQVLIRSMASADHDQQLRTKLTDLVEIVVQRAYRCKDREYVRVARAVDNEDLRRRLGTAAASENPWARLHAGYVLRLLNRPELPNTQYTWRTWLAATSGGQQCL